MPLTDYLSAAGALVLVLGLILLLRFGTRLLGPRRLPGASQPLWLAGQLGLDGKRRLQLVQCGEHQLMVLTGGATDMLLAWPPVPPVAPIPTTPAEPRA